MTAELLKREESGADVRMSAGLRPGHEPPKRAGSFTWTALFFSIAVGGTVMSASITDSASPLNTPTQAQVIGALRITEINWHKGGFNNIMMLNAAVQNSGASDVSDIQMVCDHPSDGVTKVDSNVGTIYGPFPAGKSKLIHEFDMGVFHDQANVTRCSIVHATLEPKRWGRVAG